jgi:acetyl-CoA carboxylase carboxyl transferase subunit beta
MIFHRELEKNLHVCQHCGHHMRLGVRERIAMLLDEGWETLEPARTPIDPLRFRDVKKYSERLKEAQAKTGRPEALNVASGMMGGLPVVVAAMDFEFMAGSMGIAVGEAMLAAGRRAIERRGALLVVAASGGARMQEGILSLMQMARTTIAVEEVRGAGLPYIVVLTDPTTGGVSASFAMLGDITLAEPGAVIGFAGARVIEQTIRESLPEGFQRAEYLLDHGFVDMVVNRHALRDTLIRILGLLRDASSQPEAPGVLPVLAGPIPERHNAERPAERAAE